MTITSIAHMRFLTVGDTHPLVYRTPDTSGISTNELRDNGCDKQTLPLWKKKNIILAIREFQNTTEARRVKNKNVEYKI